MSAAQDRWDDLTGLLDALAEADAFLMADRTSPWDGRKSREVESAVNLCRFTALQAAQNQADYLRQYHRGWAASVALKGLERAIKAAGGALLEAGRAEQAEAVGEYEPLAEKRENGGSNGA